MLRISPLVAALASVAVAAPFAPFPLQDGFPTPTPQQLQNISKLAGGTLPNGGLPTSLSASATTTFQLIALNEQFEVAFFTSLLQNITQGASGYDLGGFNKTLITDSLTAIVNQEELHAIGANAILSSAGKETIQPCQYQFPVTSFVEAITLANTFTDLVLATLPLAQVGFGSDGGDETGLVQLVGSIIAQEGEQNGAYRYLRGLAPSAAPFLTTGHPALTFTALQSFLVPGSCPNLNVLSAAIPTFYPLNVVSGVQASNTTVTYSTTSELGVSADKYSMLYLSGQNTPVVVSVSAVQNSGNTTSFQASLPFDLGFSKGLTIGALLNCTGIEFDSINDAAQYIKAGPALIEIQ